MKVMKKKKAMKAMKESHEGDEQEKKGYDACHEGRSSAHEGHEEEVNIESGFCSGCGDVHAFECCRHDFFGYDE